MSAELFLHVCDVKCCTEGIIRLENVIQGFGICIAAVTEVFWYQALNTVLGNINIMGRGGWNHLHRICTKAALIRLKDTSGVQFCQVLMSSNEFQVGEMQ